jgi:hypothetical protein
VKTGWASNSIRHLSPRYNRLVFENKAARRNKGPIDELSLFRHPNSECAGGVPRVSEEKEGHRAQGAQKSQAAARRIALTTFEPEPVT